MSSQAPIPHTLPLPGGIPDTHRPHTESTTTILVHKDNTAFLNPVQQYNRDLSIACIRGWNELRKEEAEERWRRKQERMKETGKGKGKGKGKKVDGQEQAEEGGEGGKEEVVAGPSKERTYKAQKFTILEALSATGLRAIRYAKEIPDVRYVLANDLSPSACDAMRMNVALNGVAETVRRTGEGSNGASKAQAEGSGVTGQEHQEEGTNGQEASKTDLEASEESASNGELSYQEQMDRVGRREGCTGVVKINEGDACALMYSRRTPSTRVDVVDLDPYGSASPFIDSAIGAIADGGLLCVTCTDLAVLAGSQYPEKSYSHYGGVSINAEYSHEVALRLVLHSLAVCAAKYGRYITPLLSFSIDFYVRLFVRIDTGPVKVKQLASQVGTVHVCSFCQAHTQQPFGKVIAREDKHGNVQKTYKPAPALRGEEGGCEHCGGTLHLGGPMWLGPIQDSAFAERVLKGIENDQDKYGTWARMRGMLTVAGQELDEPFYFTTNRLHGLFHASSGAVTHTISALLNAGYKVSRSHASQGSLKTDAPRAFLYDMVREYGKTNPIRVDKLAENSPARVMNAREQVYKVDFTPHPDTKRFERGEKVFYQVNPTANWGPGTKARTVKSTTTTTAAAAAASASETPVVSADAPAAAPESVPEGSAPEKRKAEQEDNGEEQVAKRAKSEVGVAAEGDEEAAMNL